MTGVSVQFHALPTEIPNLIAGLISDDNIFVTSAAGNPPQFVPHKSLDSFVGVEGVRALFFTIEAPRLQARSLYEFRVTNPESLVLEIGRLTDEGLEESWLSSSAENKSTLKLWRRASKSLRAGMLSGAEAVNNSNGTIAPIKWHSFTKGALEVYKEGVKILPPAGNTTIKLPINL